MSRGAFIAAFLMSLLTGSASGQGALTPAPGTVPASGHGTGAGGILPVVLAARIGEYADRTRLVIEISDPFQMRMFTLANPDRVVIDMPEVFWKLDGTAKPSGRGVIKSYRYGLFRTGDSRFVIDLNGPATTSAPVILPPQDGHGYRVVVDLFASSQPKFEQASGWPSDLRAQDAQRETALRADAAEPGTSARIPSAQDAGTAKRIVVIDAGHGGIDSGTIGVDGTLEKNVVLDEARRVRKTLQKHGYDVRLTRDSDVYIPLRERVNIARAYNADLFVSLHADSNPDPLVSGASVYTLSESGSDKEAAALARKENQSDIIAGVDLTGESSPVAGILIDLAQRDTMNRSSRFAGLAVAELGHATDILPREPHRSAAFVVLKAPDVPAALIELGYLTNSSDCAQARTNDWRDGVASAIANAVDRYFGTGAPALAAATKQAAN